MRRCSTPGAAWSPPAWSTCTPTSASPAREEAETVETGARAASLGGFTAVVAMPNTEPALDSAEAVRNVLELARGRPAEVAVAGAITVGRAGERLAPMAELAALGVRLFTDDGAGVQSAGLMRRALEYASGLGVTLAQHCEDAHPGRRRGHARGGVVEPARDPRACRRWPRRSWWPGTSPWSGPPAPGSTSSTCRPPRSVDLVRRAKAEGLAVTAEAAPHHFTLTDACAAGYDPVFKVNPPLRPPGDVDAVKAGLADGTIDAIATDHAPHAPETKDLPFDQAPPGMLGLQTALALALTELDLPLARRSSPS